MLITAINFNTRVIAAYSHSVIQPGSDENAGMLDTDALHTQAF
ncbi:hypothetical protein [Hydrogeniiclostridium mannosilyticum]